MMVKKIDNRWMFKSRLFEEDVLKILHITKDELNTILMIEKGFTRYNMGGKNEYMFGEIKNYLKLKQKKDDKNL